MLLRTILQGQRRFREKNKLTHDTFPTKGSANCFGSSEMGTYIWNLLAIAPHHTETTLVKFSEKKNSKENGVNTEQILITTNMSII